MKILNEAFPAGVSVPFAGAVAPHGWLLCDGSTVSRALFPALFLAIGTAWGNGDGATTFHLPDMRGRVPRGVDGGAGRDPDRATRTASNAGGNTGDNVGSVQSDAMQGHRHNVRNPSGTEAAGVNYCGSTTAGTGIMSGNSSRGVGDFEVRGPITNGVNGTPREASETRSQNGGFNFIIKI